MSVPKFKVMADAYGKPGLYKRVEKADATAMEGWVLICEEEDFPAVRHALPIPQPSWPMGSMLRAAAAVVALSLSGCIFPNPKSKPQPAPTPDLRQAAERGENVRRLGQQAQADAERLRELDSSARGILGQLDDKMVRLLD